MNDDINIKITNESTNSIKFSLWSSPSINHINFIKGNKNIITKREYVRAEIKIKEDIYTKYIFDYYKGYNIVYLSFIELIKTKYNIKNNKTHKSYTVLNRNNTLKTNKLNKYYNKRFNEKKKHYALNKGYGKILLEYIENYYKNKGIQYIILIPSTKSLIKYYEKLGYKIKYIPNESVNKEENNYQIRMNIEAISQYMIMYKEL